MREKLKALMRTLFPGLYQEPDDPYAQYHMPDPTIKVYPVVDTTASSSASGTTFVEAHGKSLTIGGIAFVTAASLAVAVSSPSPGTVVIALICVIASVLIVLRIVRGPLAAADDHTLPTPPQPSRRVARGMTGSEKLLWESREHPISLWYWWVGVVVLQPVAVLIGAKIGFGTAVLAWLAGMAAFGVRVFVWDRNRLCITNQRLLAVTGIIAISHKTMPLAKMTDQTANFPALSNILAWLRVIKAPYATLIVESAGQDQALSTVLYVPDGHKVNKLIMSMVLKEP